MTQPYRLATPPDIAGPLSALLDKALANPKSRIMPLSVGDRVFWLKRPEQLTLIEWFQKGNAATSFAAERAGLRHMAARRLPVTQLVADEADFLLTADAGPSLAMLLKDAPSDPATRLAAFAGAGRALAEMHAARERHGRPAVRDICWDGSVARFIDLEKFRPGRVDDSKLAADILIFLHSAFAITGRHIPEIDAFADAYCAAGQARLWDLAEARARRYLPLLPLARGLSALRPSSRDLRGIALGLDWMGHSRYRRGARAGGRG